MAIDPVSRKAFRSPLFVAGVLMLMVGLVPIAVGVISGWNQVAGASALSAFAPIGAILMAVARSKASSDWKQGR